ncbi:hypothetical protein E2C01_061669 [Portunus trituberculatus]|uniref:Uncharacterized protein n=1 Tax=Portunus trituberculatus TaxID=210409 RepID=A0A5B7H8S9_PORTR|nr:hypothetical protein [Portunus trituberculatus]
MMKVTRKQKGLKKKKKKRLSGRESPASSAAHLISALFFGIPCKVSLYALQNNSFFGARSTRDRGREPVIHNEATVFGPSTGKFKPRKFAKMDVVSSEVLEALLAGKEGIIEAPGGLWDVGGEGSDVAVVFYQYTIRELRGDGNTGEIELDWTPPHRIVNKVSIVGGNFNTHLVLSLNNQIPGPLKTRLCLTCLGGMLLQFIKSKEVNRGHPDNSGWISGATRLH